MRNKPTEIDAGIQVGFDANFENRWSRIQRIGRVLMLLFVLAGLGGLFGRGPLSRTIAMRPDAQLQVTYEWTARYQTPSVIEVVIERRAIQTGLVRLRISGDILDKLRLQQVSPQPWLTQILPADNTLVFRTDPTQASAKVRLVIQPSRIGRIHGSIGLDDRPAVEFDQFIWP